MEEAKKELLNEKTYYEVMNSYYYTKKQITESMISRNASFGLVKDIVELIKLYNDEDMKKSKNICMRSCLEEIKKIKLLNQELKEIEEKKNRASLKLVKR